MPPLQFIGQSAGGLGDNLKASRYRIDRKAVRQELFERSITDE